MKKDDINCNERLSESNMNTVISKSVCNSYEDKCNETKKLRIIIKNIHSKIKNQPKNATNISIGRFFDYRDGEIV